MKALLQALQGKMKEQPKEPNGNEVGSELAPSLGAMEAGDGAVDLGALVQGAEGENAMGEMELQKILQALGDSKGPGGSLRERAGAVARTKMGK